MTKAINIAWDIDHDEDECCGISLPEEINIPKDITDMEDISDYISGVTGFCHNGFNIKE